MAFRIPPVKGGASSSLDEPDADSAGGVESSTRKLTPGKTHLVTCGPRSSYTAMTLCRSGPVKRTIQRWAKGLCSCREIDGARRSGRPG